MKIRITEPVRHDGKDLEVGEVVDMADKDAKALLKAGHAEVPKQPKADGDKPPKA